MEPLLSPELSVLSHRRISEEKNVTAVSTLMARAKYGLNKQKREVRTSQCGEKMHRSNKKSWMSNYIGGNETVSYAILSLVKNILVICLLVFFNLLVLNRPKKLILDPGHKPKYFDL